MPLTTKNVHRMLFSIGPLLDGNLRNVNRFWIKSSLMCLLQLSGHFCQPRSWTFRKLAVGTACRRPTSKNREFNFVSAFAVLAGTLGFSIRALFSALFVTIFSALFT